MKAFSLLLLSSLLILNLDAQEKGHSESLKIEPQMTEFWTPQPKVVVPGDIQTLSAPSDAIILFDGKDLSLWQHSDGTAPVWKVHDGVATVVKGTGKGDIYTKQAFGSCQLHVEWCTPEDIQGESQSRGNSGVFIGPYEIQILDNYNNETYVNGMCGSIYKQTPPLVNALRKPGGWNTYDIIYTAPVFKEDGTYLYPPRVTVFLNNILVQNNTRILGSTEFIGLPHIEKHGFRSLGLQTHGDPSKSISFRNIWVREL